METFEEMKKRYQNDMLRYAKRARVELQPASPAAQSAEPAAPQPLPPTEPVLQQTAPPINPVPVPQPVGEAPDRMEGDNGTGTLVVRTFTAREAFPLEGTLIIVSRYIDDRPTLQWAGLTDISGNTPQISLPAPNKGLSERPGDNRPYASYNIQAIKDGYYTAEFRNVPVFSGVTAVQPVEMVPLPEQGKAVPEMIVVERGPNL